MSNLPQRILASLSRRLSVGVGRFLYALFACFPVRRKIIGIASQGVRYSDSAKAIFEALHRLAPELPLVWVGARECLGNLPDYVRGVPTGVRGLWELATGQVWVASYFIPMCIWRRRRQLFIETWHGGLGIKKIGNDSQIFGGQVNPETAQLTRNASLFLSNSEHLTAIYRRAFGFTGLVWKSGYPQNDLLVQNPTAFRARLRQRYQLPGETRILLYAPTFRRVKDALDPYDLAFPRLLEVLSERTGQQWVAFVRLHPAMRGSGAGKWDCLQPPIYNVTDYPDMQELVLGCDAMISDYSSCIFDGAMRGIPCFIYAADYEEYRKERGTYYTLEELPFPWATTQAGLEQAMRSYDSAEFARRWSAFQERTGLYEPGNAARTVANWILQWLDDAGALQQLQASAAAPHTPLNHP